MVVGCTLLHEHRNRTAVNRRQRAKSGFGRAGPARWTRTAEPRQPSETRRKSPARSRNNHRRVLHLQPQECAGRHLADGDRPDSDRVGVVDPVGLGALADRQGKEASTPLR